MDVGLDIVLMGYEMLEKSFTTLFSTLLKKIWGSWVITSWTWVNRVPRQPGRSTVSWGASSTALPAGQQEWLSCSTLQDTDLFSPEVLCMVLGTPGQKWHKTIGERVSRKGLQRWWRILRERYIRNSWSPLVSSALRSGEMRPHRRLRLPHGGKWKGSGGPAPISFLK